MITISPLEPIIPIAPRSPWGPWNVKQMQQVSESLIEAQTWSSVILIYTVSDRWPLGSDLPGASLFSLLTLNEKEKENERNNKKKAQHKISVTVRFNIILRGQTEASHAIRGCWVPLP